MKGTIVIFLAVMIFINVDAFVADTSVGFPVRCRYTKCPIGYYCKVVESGVPFYNQRFTECSKILNSNETFDPQNYDKVSCKGVECPEDQSCLVIFDSGFRPNCYYKNDGIFEHHATGLKVNCDTIKCPEHYFCRMIKDDKGHSNPKCLPTLKKN